MNASNSIKNKLPTNYSLRNHVYKQKYIYMICQFLLYTYIYIYIYIYTSKLGNHSRGRHEAPFSKATTPRCRGGCYFFP